MGNDFENLTNPTKLHKDTYREMICYGGHILIFNRLGFLVKIKHSRGSNVSLAEVFIEWYRNERTKMPFNKKVLNKWYTVGIRENK